MGRIIITLVLSVYGICLQAETLKYTDLFDFKQGELTNDEVWSGKILLLGDVIVPQGVQLSIEKNSWLIFNEADLAKTGKNINRPELIVHGQLNTPLNDKTIKIYSLGDMEVQNYINNSLDSEDIALKPQEEPLTDLKEDLHKSRNYYGLIWAAVYSIWLIL